MASFKHSLFRNVGLAVQHYNMINKKDRILVALSGGKDSFTMLDALSRLRERAPVDFSLTACIVHPGFPGFKTEGIEKWLVENKFDYHIERCSIYETVFAEMPKKTGDACFLCARHRRSVLYRMADRMGCTKIALGHHMDDFIESTLMSMMYNGRIETMLPIFGVTTAKFRVIRPLMYVSEETTKKYSAAREFPVTCCCCPLCKGPNMRRAKVKRFLLEYAKDDPKVKQIMFRSLSNFNAGYMLDMRYNDALREIKFEKCRPPAEPLAAGTAAKDGDDYGFGPEGREGDGFEHGADRHAGDARFSEGMPATESGDVA